MDEKSDARRSNQVSLVVGTHFWCEASLESQVKVGNQGATHDEPIIATAGCSTTKWCIGGTTDVRTNTSILRTDRGRLLEENHAKQRKIMRDALRDFRELEKAQ